MMVDAEGFIFCTRGEYNSVTGKAMIEHKSSHNLLLPSFFTLPCVRIHPSAGAGIYSFWEIYRAVHASLCYDSENPKQDSGNQHQYYG